MNKCIEEAIEETIANISEKDEFKRRFEVFIQNYFESGSTLDDLQRLIRLITVSDSEKEEVDE